jgi:Protein of unknown function (DUF2442)
MICPVKVTALAGYKIHLAYADGVTGVMNLSDVAGCGVFAPLKNEEVFKKVHVNGRGKIAWAEEIEICPDAVYWELIGISF